MHILNLATENIKSLLVNKFYNLLTTFLKTLMLGMMEERGLLNQTVHASLCALTWDECRL